MKNSLPCKKNTAGTARWPSFLLLFFATTVTCFAAENPLKITVSILPQKYFVEKIAKGEADIQVLVTPGNDPHTFEPKPQQIKRLSESKVYIASGIDFEFLWIPKFKRLYPQLAILNETKEDEHHEKAYAFHLEKHRDPHTWLSPQLVKKQAALILKELTALRPEKKEFFEKNHATFEKEITDLDTFLHQTFDAIPREKVFLTAHPAWKYFAADYGLKEISIMLGGKEPAPKDLKKLLDTAQKYQLKTVFVSPQYPSKSAEVIAKNLGGKVEVLDDLNENWDLNLREVASKIAASLK